MKLKSLLFWLLILGVCQQASNAQGKISPERKQQVDHAIANGAVKYSIAADKTLLEPNEDTDISVNLTIPGEVDDNGIAQSLPDEIPMMSDVGLPYKAANWKILQGGGKLSALDEFSQSYTAPASAPPDKTMIVSVELIPTKDGLPKIILNQTLYFTKNETSFVLNLPQIGAVNTKYISVREPGVKVPAMPGIDSRAAAGMSAEARAAMAQAQAQMKAAQAQSGIDLAIVTSSEMALYDAPSNQTAIKFTKLSQQANDGKAVTVTMGGVVLVFNFKGKGVGSYSLDDKDTGLGLMLGPMRSCGCGVHSEIDREFLCKGKINITEMTEKTITGTVSTVVWTSVGESIFRGNLYGKFTVNRAN